MKRILRFLAYFTAVHIIVLALSHCNFSHFARKSYERAREEKPYDVIIVPGIPYAPGQSNDVMKMRVFWAKHLYDSGYARNIIFSGSAVYSPYVEAEVMKAMADSLGIPSDNLFKEVTAEHSTENVYYGWRMAKELGFEKIALATDPYQAGLLRGFIRRHAPEVKPVPIVFGTMGIDTLHLPDVDTTLLYVENFVSITERESFWERFRGTMGKRVKKEKKQIEASRKKQRSTETSGN